MPSPQLPRRAFAHVRHAQRIQPFFQRQSLRRLARRDNLRRILLAENPRFLRCPEVERGQRLQRHIVNLWRIFHQLEFDEPRRHHLAQPVDRERLSAAKKRQPACPLRAAIVILAFPRHAAPVLAGDFQPGDSAPAHRTFSADHRAQIELHRPGDTLFENRFQHRRDYLARLLDLHQVAHADILAANLILVVQGCPADGAAREQHRLQLRHRAQDPRLPHLDRDRAQPRARRVGFKFIRDRPARRLRRFTHRALQRPVIQLHHRTVGAVGETPAQAIEFSDRVPRRVDSAHAPHFLDHGQTPSAEPLMQFRLRAHDLRLTIPQTVEHDRQLAPRYFGGIELLDRARREVTRIRVKIFTRRSPLGVDPVKLRRGKIDLTSNLHHARRNSG